MSNAALTLARVKRDELLADVRAIIDKAETDKREITPDEATAIKTARANPDVVAVEERIKILSDSVEADQAAARAIPASHVGTVAVRSEPLTYQRHDRRQSYFRDLGLSLVGKDADATRRLEQHRAEVAVELPKIEARNEALAARQLEELGAVTKRDITRVDAAGGTFVPPLWLIDEYAAMIRAGRVACNLVRNVPLPGGTDSINLPRITTGVSAAIQTTDNAAVSETDIVTTSVAGAVNTIAGQQDIALQLLEQSPIMFDEVIYSDLLGAYNAALDVQVLNGSGASGQHTGFHVVSGSTSVAYTDASPTVAEFWPSGGQCISQSSTARKQQFDYWIMHPRRWYWMVSALDSSNRPLVVPAQAGPNNAYASIGAVPAEGYAGTWHGLPVYLDQNVPVLMTAGAGSAGTEDTIALIRGADHILFEGAIRTRALPEVLSGTLTVRLQLYAYSAFICGRFPTGVGRIQGTGLAAPSGF